jgi:hypothetical protein
VSANVLTSAMRGLTPGKPRSRPRHPQIKKAPPKRGRSAYDRTGTDAPLDFQEDRRIDEPPHRCIAFGSVSDLQIDPVAFPNSAHRSLLRPARPVDENVIAKPQVSLRQWAGNNEPLVLPSHLFAPNNRAAPSGSAVPRAARAPEAERSATRELCALRLSQSILKCRH